MALATYFFVNQLSAVSCVCVAGQYTNLTLTACGLLMANLPSAADYPVPIDIGLTADSACEPLGKASVTAGESDRKAWRCTKVAAISEMTAWPSVAAQMANDGNRDESRK